MTDIHIKCRCKWSAYFTPIDPEIHEVFKKITKKKFIRLWDDKDWEDYKKIGINFIWDK